MGGNFSKLSQLFSLSSSFWFLLNSLNSFIYWLISALAKTRLGFASKAVSPESGIMPAFAIWLISSLCFSLIGLGPEAVFCFDLRAMFLLLFGASLVCLPMEIPISNAITTMMVRERKVLLMMKS